jgi:hypothetical protein
LSLATTFTTKAFDTQKKSAEFGTLSVSGFTDERCSALPSSYPARGAHITQLLFCSLACCSFQRHATTRPTPGGHHSLSCGNDSGLTEVQVRGSLGALLVCRVRERLPKPEFDELSKAFRMPTIMREVHARGIVTRPLDDIGDYEASLASLGIGQPLASQFAPAVVEYLGAAGFERERSMLARVLD